MVRAVCSASEAMQPVVGRPGSGKTYATAACVEALVSSGVPVAGCAVSATAAAELEATVGFRRHTGRPAQTIASLLVELEQHGDRLVTGTVLLVDEASMVGTRDLARLAAHVDAAGGCIKLVGDPDQHASVDTGGVFKALAARRGPDLVQLVGNRRQKDPNERAAIEAYRAGRVGDALDRYDAAGRVVRQPTARATYDALVQDWWADRQAGSPAPMLAGTNAARRALNARARSLLEAEGELTGEPLNAHGRQFMVGDEVVARRNDRSLHRPGSTTSVKNGSIGKVVEVDTDRGELVVDFTREGTLRLPAEYLTAGHVEHAYSRTTYGIQGATLDRARYHPSDAFHFEEGYVAVTRATDATHLYVVDGDVDDETGHHVIEEVGTGLPTLAEALARRRDQRLATETDPLALDAARLGRAHTLAELRDRSRALDRVLAQQPPSVAHELAGQRRSLSALGERRAEHDGERPSWKPSSRRAAAQALSSLDRSTSDTEQQISALKAEQARHDEFALTHENDIADRELLLQAAAARRLRLRVDAVADAAPALTRLLGSRPTSQRERLRWDRAVESIAVHLDESARPMPDHAVTLAEILGPRPAEPLARFDHDRVARAVREAQAPDRALDQSRGIG